MTRKSGTQLLVVLLLLLAAGWFMRDKVALVSPRLAEWLARNKAQPEAKEGGPLKAVIAPDEISVRASDMPPLDKSTKPLLKAPTMPTYRAPVVFYAYVQGPKDSQTTVAAAFEKIIRYQLRATLPDNLVLNLIPVEYMLDPYRRQDDSGHATDQSNATYVSDAESIGAQFCITTHVAENPTATQLPTVSLNLTDLKTSQTKDWSSARMQPPPAHFADILAPALKTSAAFCGISDDDIRKSKMLEGLPKDETWEFLASSPRADDEVSFSTAIESDPDCRVLYETATSYQNPHAYADMALHKWPDDPRLLRRKVQMLTAAKKEHAAFIYLSEIIRRYPECILFTHDLPEVLNAVMPETKDATAAPKYWSASVDYLRAQAARFPNNWYVQWDAALGLNYYARLLRGAQTIDKIPRESAIQYGRAYDESADYMQHAVDRRPDSSNLLRAYLYMQYTAGYNDLDWQTSMIERIHRIDPSNFKAETIAAFSHSIGWGVPDDFWHFINLALKNHPNDAKAMYGIGYELGTELSRRMGWKAMTPEDVFKNPNPLSDKFIECTEFAMDHGIQVDKWMGGMLREMYRARFGEAKVQELYESGKHWGLTGEAASHAYKANDFEHSLRLARVALAKSPTREEREVWQQLIVKSLWKLKRYDEALTEARNGISEFAEKPTFHYLVAVVGTEKGGMDEEAYQEAYRAVEINSTTDVMNAAFERLRAKLNKPQHPRLVSK